MDIKNTSLEYTRLFAKVMPRTDLIKGTFTALLTPFNENMEVDEPTLRKFVDFQIKGGVNGLVPLGTTGESATLDLEETKKVFEIVVDQASKSARKPFVLAGTGSNCTREAIELTKIAEDAGADGALLVSPFYNKPTQAGLIEHFKAVSKATSLPLVLYNIQSRTGVNIEVPSLVELSKIPNIVGVKEASGSIDQITDTIRKVPPIFKVMSGDDGMTFHLMSLGGQGVISVASNVAPKLIVQFTEVFAAGDLTTARALHMKLYDLFKVLFLETNPGPVKCAAELMGLMSQRMRLPMVPPSSQNREKIKKVLEDLKLI
ncbi:MAG: dihydrodipicolinate synthase [Promethearchaeota archaeon CR_4]|nr:MAG: dihydrodipicolinate synthase [Candidatus Lokiarchaeota archaeon CR_4]